MGKNSKKDPAKAAAKKAKAAAKQEKSAIKASKKDVKAMGTEEDIETILAEFQQKELARTCVTVTTCSQPSPRSNFSLTSLSNNEFLLFGGEFCDGEGTTVYNEVYRWNIDKNEWKLVESLNTPPPRCSHQAVLFKDKVYIFGGEYATLDQFHHYRDMWALDLKTNIWEEIPASKDGPSARSGHRMVVWRNCILLFGGFYEALREVRWYSDLYLFSFSEQKWMQVPPKPYVQVPRARSGFLMTVHPSDDAIFVFGGYSKEKVTATGGSGSKKSEGKIHTDMWMLSLKGVISGGKGGGSSRLDLGKITWQKLSNKGSPPSIRCGASMVAYKNKGVYFGGVNDSEGPRHSIISTFFNDLYAFDFDRKRWYQLGLKAPKSEKKSRSKKKKLLSEGDEKNVADDDSSENESSDDEDDDEDDEELLNMRRIEKENENCFGYIDDDGNIVYVKLDDDLEEKEQDNSFTQDTVTEPQTQLQEDDGGDWVTISEVDVALLKDDTQETQKTEEGAVTDHSEGEMEIIKTLTKDSLKEAAADTNTKFDLMTGVECSQLQRYFSENTSVPVPRINASLVMRGCSLFVYGGLTEIGDAEVTLDDCWSLDLNKRDQWKKILPGTMNEMVWKGDDDIGSEMTGDTGGSDSEFSDEEGSDDEGDNLVDEDAKKTKKKKSKDSNSRSSRKAGEASGVRAEMQNLKAQLPGEGEDENEYPLSVVNEKDAGYRVESLKEFYGRSSVHWKQVAIEAWKEQKLSSKLTSSVSLTNQNDTQTSSETMANLSNLASSMSGQQENLSDKEIKKIAFSLCQERYQQVLEVAVQLVALETSLVDDRGDSGRSGRSGKKKKR